MDRTKEPHVERDTCNGRHCYSCMVDEIAITPHTVCPQCNHVYPTEQTLIADYLQISVEKVFHGWVDYQNLKTLYCPRCRHFWGRREEN